VVQAAAPAGVLDEHQLERRVGNGEVGVARPDLGRLGVEQLRVDAIDSSRSSTLRASWTRDTRTSTSNSNPKLQADVFPSTRVDFVQLSTKNQYFTNRLTDLDVDLVLWLCSSGSTYLVGTVVHVDGGAGVGSRAGHEIVDDDVRYDWVTGRVR
jgi:hypothetical protein